MVESKKVVFDLFAGAGGFGLGFRMAGFDVGVSVEKDNWAVDTLKANQCQGDEIIHEDIRHLASRSQILDVVGRKSPDIIIGGPPCQGFSVAGPQKDPDDPRNTLFQNFAQWVEVFSPKVFVMENVTGIINRRNSSGERVLDIIVATFQSLGYNVELWKLNAALYGVPQQRNRLFIVGNRLGGKITPPSPTHFITRLSDSESSVLKPAITVSEAISDLPYIKSGEGMEQMDYVTTPWNEYQSWARCDSDYVNNHVAMIHTKRIIERYAHIQSGKNVKDLPLESQVRKRGGGGEISSSAYNSNYRHLKDNMISYTIPASFYSTFIHPIIPRNITSREAARLQSFPDWYVFKGKRTVISSKLLQRKGRSEENYLSQYNQIGNAVPPLLSFNIAKHIKGFIDRKNRIANTELVEVDLESLD